MAGVVDGRASAISAFAAAKSLLKRQREQHEQTDSLANEDSTYSSDSDDDAATGHNETANKRERLQLSTWAPAKSEISPASGKHTTFKMLHHERAAFLGVYDLVVEHGAVDVYGATLCPSSGKCRIYAPAISAVPSITCKTRECKVTLYSCRNYLRQLAKASPLYSRAFPRLSTPDGSRVARATANERSFHYIEWSDEVEDGVVLNPLVCPREWIGTFEAITVSTREHRRPAKVLVCGTQKSGKSTFCRMLINHAISRQPPQQAGQRQKNTSLDGRFPFKTAFLLDLDPGQPELSPPGQISLCQIATPLLGPPLSHPSTHCSASVRTIRSHTLANATSQDDTDHFLACARDLMRNAHSVHAQYPSATLVINTPGWITAQGLDLTTTILTEAKHTATILLGLPSLRVASDERDTIRTTLRVAASSTQTFELDAQAPSHASRTPAELRAMHAQSYFHLKHPRAEMPRWAPYPLNSAHYAPLTLHYGSAAPDLLGLLSYFETPAPAHIVPWIHRSTVALCAVDDPALAAEIQRATRPTPAEHLPYLSRPASRNNAAALTPPDPARTRALGLAYVRSIDGAARTVSLITPAAPLVRVLLEDGGPPRLFLAAGRFETPTWAYAEDGMWARRSARARVGEYDTARAYVKRLRAGERADLVWRAGATARFGKGV